MSLVMLYTMSMNTATGSIQNETDFYESTKRQLEEATRKAEALRSQVAEVEKQIEMFKAAIQVYEGYVETRLNSKRTVQSDSETPLQEPSTSAEKPKLSDAIQIVMRTRPSHDWNAAEIQDELTHRDWMAAGAKPMATLRAALFRLSKNDVIDNVDRGRYRLAGQLPPTEPTVEHGATYIETSDTPEGGNAYRLAM